MPTRLAPNAPIRVAAALVVLVTSACRSRDATKPSEPGRPTPAPSGLATGDEALAGTVSGSADGRDFGPVAASFVIESPDSSAATIVYLFSKPVRCLDLSFSDWDQSIGSNTMVLELDIVGKAPGSYLVVDSPAPSPREAGVRVARAGARGASPESRATGGWLTIDGLSPGGPARGSFTVTFGSRQMTGSFDAAFCPGGHEP
jgi:hypothetical protein